MCLFVNAVMPVKAVILHAALWCEDTLQNTAEGKGQARRTNVTEANRTGTQ